MGGDSGMSFNREYVLGRAVQGQVFSSQAAYQFTTNPQAQLWNPVGSGKNLIVFDVTIYGSQAATTGYILAYSNSQMTGGTPIIQNHNFNNVISPVGQLIYGSVSSPPTGFAIGLTTSSLPPLSMVDERDAIIVSPGTGLLVCSLTQNIVAYYNFAWIEEIPSS
jgi:hypothetical protein